MNYRRRFIESHVRDLSGRFGAVLVTGARQAGVMVEVAGPQQYEATTPIGMCRVSSCCWGSFRFQRNP
ncbi:MAG: hypothetical protein K8R59_17130 [Thermoanaerobaculales bacterium]|nr:hypothetical protein [Thermoanaerobaculales bacterium]